MDQFLQLFEYQFFRNALIGTILTSITAGFIGTYIVSRKMVFISDGITHASFGGIGIAYYLGLNPFAGALLFGIGTALGIEWIQKKENIREDSAIAILWSLGMAIGILFIFLTPGYTPNLMSFLFGNILSITYFDLIIMAIITLMVSTLFIVFYRPILYSAFDPEFAQASGLPVVAIRYCIMVVIAITVVVSIKIAGIILVMSLFTIPQVIANMFTRNFGKIIPLSMLFAFLGVTGGLIASYYADLPSGATIILTLVVLFLILKVAQKFITARR
jgi:zinc transport system permease protein